MITSTFAVKELVKKKPIDSTEGSGEKSSAKELVDFIERSRLGENIPNEKVIRIAQLFQDELTLDNIARPQLTSLCEYMGLPPYGSDNFLRFQIRNKIRRLREVRYSFRLSFIILLWKYPLG